MTALIGSHRKEHMEPLRCSIAPTRCFNKKGENVQVVIKEARWLRLWWRTESQSASTSPRRIWRRRYRNGGREAQGSEQRR
jgi:hypothetical protein